MKNNEENLIPEGWKLFMNVEEENTDELSMEIELNEGDIITVWHRGTNPPPTGDDGFSKKVLVVMTDEAVFCIWYHVTTGWGIDPSYSQVEYWTYLPND